MLAGLAAAVAASPARADVTLGGEARSAAMGGAGLALVGNGAARLNPAALALGGRQSVTAPYIGLRTEGGIGLGQVRSRLSSGSLNADAAGSLARDFGKRDGALELSAGIGLPLSPFEVSATGVARVRLLPNAALRAWSEAGGDTNAVPNDARGDVFGAAVYSLPSVGFARRVGGATGGGREAAVGIRVKSLRALYTHYVVNADTLRANGDAPAAPEIGPNRDSLKKSGLGVDVGLLARPRDGGDGFSAALLITNLIAPNLSFEGTDAAGAPKRYDLQPRSVSLGSALRRGNSLVALDLVDVTGAYSSAQVRLGAEVKSGAFALRSVSLGARPARHRAHPPVLRKSRHKARRSAQCALGRALSLRISPPRTQAPAGFAARRSSHCASTLCSVGSGRCHSQSASSQKPGRTSLWTMPLAPMGSGSKELCSPRR